MALFTLVIITVLPGSANSCPLRMINERQLQLYVDIELQLLIRSHGTEGMVLVGHFRPAQHVQFTNSAVYAISTGLQATPARREQT